eukprot:358378-Chlamydomonas_euryale.AAC.4
MMRRTVYPCVPHVHGAGINSAVRVVAIVRITEVVTVRIRVTDLVRVSVRVAGSGPTKGMLVLSTARQRGSNRVLWGVTYALHTCCMVRVRVPGSGPVMLHGAAHLYTPLSHI